MILVGNKAPDMMHDVEDITVPILPHQDVVDPRPAKAPECFRDSDVYAVAKLNIKSTAVVRSGLSSPADVGAGGCMTGSALPSRFMNCPRT
jgi:hypothetical protein